MQTLSTGLIIDAVILLMILLGTVIGIKRGLFKSLAGFLVVVVAVVGAYYAANTLSAPVTQWVVPRLNDVIAAQVEAYAQSASTAAPQEAQNAEEDHAEVKPDGFWGAVQEWMRSARESVDARVNEQKQAATDSLAQLLTDAVSAVVNKIVFAILFLLVFLVLLIVLGLVCKAMDEILSRVPGVRQVNAIGGGAFGLAETLLWLFVIGRLYSMLDVFIPDLPVQDTYLMRFFIEFSPLKFLFSL